MTPSGPPPVPGTSFLTAGRQVCPAIATLPKSQPVLSLGGAQSNPIFAKRHRRWKNGKWFRGAYSLHDLLSESFQVGIFLCSKASQAL